MWNFCKQKLSYGQANDNMTVKHIVKKILHSDSLTVTRIHSI